MTGTVSQLYSIYALILKYSAVAWNSAVAKQTSDLKDKSGLL